MLQIKFHPNFCSPLKRMESLNGGIYGFTSPSGDSRDPINGMCLYVKGRCKRRTNTVISTEFPYLYKKTPGKHNPHLCT